VVGAVLVLIGLGFLGGGGTMLFLVRKALRHVAAVRAATPLDVGRLTEGYRLVWGTVAGPRQTAPLTGRICAWWALEVYRVAASQESTVSRLIRDEVAPEPLGMSDARACGLIFPEGAEIVPSSLSAWHGLDPEPMDRDPPVQSGTAFPRWPKVRGYRYFERYIALDAPVFVLGEVLRLPGEEADRRVWAMRRAKGRPFIISALAPEDYVAYQRAGTRNGLMAGGAAAAFGAALIGWVLLG
jgi:hypothetical protein